MTKSTDCRRDATACRTGKQTCRQGRLHGRKQPQAACATQEAEIAPDFFFIRAVFAFAGFVSTLKPPDQSGGLRPSAVPLAGGAVIAFSIFALQNDQPLVQADAPRFGCAGAFFPLSSNQQPQKHTAHNDYKRHINPSFCAAGGRWFRGRRMGRCVRRISPERAWDAGKARGCGKAACALPSRLAGVPIARFVFCRRSKAPFPP